MNQRSEMIKQKAILDTDPGIDDLLAILFAYASPECELLGVTTVAGNCPVEDGIRHAMALKELLGADDLPISRGCYKPLVRPLRTQKTIYGMHERIPLDDDPMWHSRVDRRHSVDFLLEQVNRFPGEITIYPLGPLTNIAAALQLDPEFAGKVKEIFLMGGAACVPGNATPTAEFNIWVDPEAASQVFESGIPITMVGLDVTGEAALHREDIPALDAVQTPVGRFIREVTRHYLDEGHPCILFDPLAVAVGLLPELVIEAPKTAVMIETKGEFTSGTTVCDFHNRFKRNTNAHVCLRVDAPRFMDLFWERVVRFSPKYT